MIWTLAVAGRDDVPEPVAVLAIIAVLFAVRLARTDSDGWAFTASAVAIARGRLALHRALPQRDGLEHQRGLQLDVSNAASGGYALKVMTIVTVLLFPSSSSTRAGPSGCSAPRAAPRPGPHPSAAAGRRSAPRPTGPGPA